MRSRQTDLTHAVHVDFGDCFETAMTRDKYPEKVPFRLTRMLVRAMEVSGIEGASLSFVLWVDARRDVQDDM